MFSLKKLLGLDSQAPAQPRPQQAQQFAPMQHMQKIQEPQLGVSSAPDLQGAFNPGATPMQGSLSVRPLQGGNDVYWQNTDGIRRNMVNPQLNDFSHNWNNY